MNGTLVPPASPLTVSSVSYNSSLFDRLLFANEASMPPHPAGAATGNPARIVVPLGQSVQIQLSKDATTVMVVSPTIADVRLISPKLLFIVGKAPGRTSIALFNNKDRIKDWIVSVTYDLRPLRQVLSTETEFGKVQVKQLLSTIVLAGEVQSPASAERVVRLAEG